MESQAGIFEDDRSIEATITLVPTADDRGVVEKVEAQFTESALQVLDSIDFCPGGLGGTAIRRVTMPMSRLERTPNGSGSWTKPTLWRIDVNLENVAEDVTDPFRNDADADGWPESQPWTGGTFPLDNCPAEANPDQADDDGDDVGDTCDESVGGADFVVDSPGDADDATADGTCLSEENTCTLRAAIQEANRDDDANGITFSIEGDIRVEDALPAVKYPTTIDAPKSPDGSASVALINDSAAEAGTGLVLRGGSSRITGLAIGGFPGGGIRIEGGSGSKVQGNLIGTDHTGTQRRPNGRSASNFGGIVIERSDGNLIGGDLPVDRNVVSGNNGIGVIVADGGKGNRVAGNYVGTDITGQLNLGNRNNGILVTATTSSSPNNPPVGTVVEDNVVAANRRGIEVYSAVDTVVRANVAGLASDGATVLGNRLDGILVYGGQDTLIVGNTSSGNGDDGILVEDQAEAPGLDVFGTTILGNRVGTDTSGLLPRGNSRTGIHVIDAERTVIGGSAPEKGNRVAANPVNIHVTGSEVKDTRIQGNDLEHLPSTAYESTIGIKVNAPDVLVGGVKPGEGNSIGGNSSSGISVGPDGDRTRIQGNRIGTAAAPSDPEQTLANGEDGIDVGGATSVVIGFGQGESPPWRLVYRRL